MRTYLPTGALSILVLVGLAATGCANDASGRFTPVQPGTLTVMTEPLPTSGFWEGKGRRPTGGMEYGMAQEIARRLDLDRVEVRTRDFSRIVRGELGDADLALALITPTAARDEVLDFTTPYLRAAPALVTRAGTEIPDVQTAQEQRFAVGLGTTFEAIVAEQIRPDRPPLRIENQSQMLEAVAGGQADVAMFDLPEAEAITRRDPRLAVAAKLSDTEPIAAALPDGSPNTEAVGSVLRAMEADGTMDDLAERWLGVSLSDSADRVPLLRTSSR